MSAITKYTKVDTLNMSRNLIGESTDFRFPRITTLSPTPSLTLTLT